jgi:signal transduction histidine kinase
MSHLPSWPSLPEDTAPPIVQDDDIRILIVDDQKSNLEVLDALLAQSGCRLVRAESANEALLALLDHDFAAIILDIKMPGMGGFELAELIKQRRRTQHVPILFLTAHMMDERDVLRGYGAGAVDYLTKPVHSDILRSKVAVFAELFRKTRALGTVNERLLHEIAERERAQEALRHVNQDLERRVADRTEALQQADRRKDEFLASLAHELRNPLAPIRSAVEILKLEGVPKPDADRARAVVVRQVDHMTRLIDDLLDVSRITNDKLNLQRGRVDLAQVVASAVETSRPIIAERRHTLGVNLPTTLVELDADPARLSQVLSNLLTNAAKYTAPGGEIKLTADVEDNAVRIHVSDNGVGIPAEMLSAVFDLFMQVGQPSGTSGGGLGIGLTLARRLVEMHGGTIEAASPGPGRGSVFSVTLPLPVQAPESFQPSRPVENDSLRTKRILVVDDNRDAAEMLAVMLTAWGQDVHVAYDALGALAAAETFGPAVVLLDIGLPQLDGYELARRIRRTSWGQTATLVAITGWGQSSDLERSRQAGIDHHLVKPVAPNLLRELLQSIDLDR